MNVLIFSPDQDVEKYAGFLVPEFPQVTFHAAKTEGEAARYIEEADVLVALSMSDDLLSRARRLQWIQAIIAGTDYIERLPSFQERKDLILTSSRGIHGPQVSELVLLFLLALSRRFPQTLHNQQRKVWERWPATLLYRKTVAILGVGTIGQAVARKCKAFDMTVLGIGPNPKQVEGVDAFFTLEDTNQVASRSDYFVSVAPATPDNHNSLGEPFFAHLPRTAFFVNVGRGEVVDEPALLRALWEGRIAGAALDTFQREPLPPDHPFWELDNVILTPHVGGMCDIYEELAVDVFRENLKRYLAGERRNLVNFVDRTRRGGGGSKPRADVEPGR